MVSEATFNRWYDAGAAAVERVTAGRRQGLYACPCCMEYFTRDQRTKHGERALTTEHVPPEKLGGTELLLTCKPCNNDAGTKLDKHAHIKDRAERFARGEVSAPMSAETMIDGLRVGMDVEYGEGGMRMTADARRSQPGGIAALEAFARRGDAEQIQLRWRLEKGYLDRPARLSWIRSAYLLAFAMSGYTYIRAHEELAALRDQFADPNARLIESLPVYPNPTGAATFLLLTRPTALRGSFFIAFPTCWTVLPGLERAAWSFDDAAAVLETHHGSGQTQLAGHRMAWPTEALYMSDDIGPER